MKKTLSIGRRPTKERQHRDDQRLAGALEPYLAGLFELQPGRDGELPAVRKKSKDPTHNPDQLDVVLMRRNPMPLENEYDVAITEPNGAALAQWIAAGIGRMFPEQYRAIAEIDACHVAAQEAQSANRRADKLRKRYYRQREEAEIAAHEPGETAYQRDRLAQIAETTRAEMEIANAIEAADRYFRLDQLDRTGVCSTTEGRRKLYQLKILSVWDTVYSDQRVEGMLPAKAGAQLRTIGNVDSAELVEIVRRFASSDCSTLPHVNIWLRDLAQAFLKL
ncbi:hypothetical protein [Marinobacter sp. MBR-105]|jgi:hypothetical protein